jgi:DNA polymerase elongation subunit (family B)
MADYKDIFTEVDGEFKLYDVQSIGEKLGVTIRTSQGHKYAFIINDFRPYFYVPNQEIPYHLPFIELNRCRKVECRHPAEVKSEREKYRYTYEADILYDFRFHFDILLNFRENPDIKPRIWFFDIEVYNKYESSFPKPNEFDKFINSIAIYDSYSDKFLTLVVAPNGQDCGKLVDGNRTIIKVKSEELLLKFFIGLLNKVEPDLIVGWNTILFDIPFLVERLKLKYPDLYKQLSPFGIEPRKHFNMVFNSDEYEIPGYISLDYMLLYKKFGAKLGSYSLESVCQHELGKGKVKYDKSLDYIYEHDFTTFIKYNTEDVNLVKELEGKLTFIQLVDQLKSITFCKLYTFNFNNTLKVGDMLIMKYIRTAYNPPMVMKTKDVGEITNKSYSGAFVRSPKVGLYYDYIIDFDASSMYPSIIRTLNISPETFLCKIVESQEVIRFHIRPFLHNRTQDWTLPTDELNVLYPNGQIKRVNIHQLKEWLYRECKGNNFTIAINGAIFRTDKVGVLKYIEDDLAKLREANKNARKVFGKLQSEIQQM